MVRNWKLGHGKIERRAGHSLTSKRYKNNQLIQWKHNMELGQQHRPRNLLPVPTPSKLQPRLTAFSSVKKPREQSSEVERDPLLQQGPWVWKPTWKVLQSHGQGSSELQVNVRGQPNRTETVPTKSFCFALLDPEAALETSSTSRSPENLQRRKEGGCKIQLS